MGIASQSKSGRPARFHRIPENSEERPFPAAMPPFKGNSSQVGKHTLEDRVWIVSNSSRGRRYDDVPPLSDIPMTRTMADASQFDGLFAAHYAALTRLIFRVVGDIGWAEELAPEADRE